MTGDSLKDTPKEQGTGQPSFSKVPNEAPQPSATKPPGLPVEHSGFFRRPSEMPSFTLQPSIIIPPPLHGEMPRLSNFNTVINAHRVGLDQHSGETAKKKRGRRPGTPKTGKEAKKKRTPRKGERDRLLEINDTRVKKKIKAHQFDSEAEDVRDFLPLDYGFGEDLCFLEKEHVPQMSKKISKSNRKVYDLLRFVKERDSETRDVKTYACKYCPKVFVKRAALGGHTAKNHPHQSDSYRLRQESLKNRRIERERFDYFKNIKK